MLAGRNIKPRYEVEPLEGTRIERQWSRDTKKNINVEQEVEVPAGYMVYFANGNSIRVKNDKELQRLGFNVPAPLVDMESGEEIGTTDAMSLKRQHRRRASRADTGEVDANQGG